MKLTLYYTPGACSMVPYINLTEAGAEFDVVALNFSKNENHGADFLKLNPKHKVPVLLIDGEPLTENVAINLWIARNFPAAKLLPESPAQEIRAISLTSWVASAIHPSLTPNAFPARYCDLPGAEESVRQCAQKMLDEHFALADSLLAGREWFLDRFSIADSHFFWAFIRATRLKPKYLDLSKFANCAAHQERMKQRASVQKLLAFEKQTIASFGK